MLTDDDLIGMEVEARADQCDVKHRLLSRALDPDAESIDTLAQIALDLVAEVRRLRRGEFTPEEFQGLCHHRDERPGCTALEFTTGCAEYVHQLFGRSASSDPFRGILADPETVRATFPGAVML